MYEVSCASCNANFEFNIDDYIHLCPYCSSGFILDTEEGAKDLIGDHYIIANRLEKDEVETIFHEWIKNRYHRPEKIKDEFRMLGSYAIYLPYWVISLEAHTFWSGYSIKAHQYPGQPQDYANRHVREEGRFSKRYRWSVLARKNPKEHWGLERIHHPLEDILVDWDGFPLDESLGKPMDDAPSMYEAKQAFKFDAVNGVTVAGIQLRENFAIARSRDQIQEYHRRISKTKVGSLYDHRTELEIIGIHLVHLPFWFVRYAFTPKSAFKFFTTAREKKILIQGYTKNIIEAELPLSPLDKVMTNLFVCGSLGILSMGLALFLHPLFFVLFLIFAMVSILSAVKIFRKNKKDPDLERGVEIHETA